MLNVKKKILVDLFWACFDHSYIYYHLYLSIKQKQEITVLVSDNAYIGGIAGVDFRYQWVVEGQGHGQGQGHIRRGLITICRLVTKHTLSITHFHSCFFPYVSIKILFIQKN